MFSPQKIEKPEPPPRPVAGGGTPEARLHDPPQPWAPGGAGSASDLAAQAEMDRQTDPGPETTPASNELTDEPGSAGARPDGASETAAQSTRSTDEPQGVDVWQGLAGSEPAPDISTDVLATPDPWTEDPGYDLDWAGKL